MTQYIIRKETPADWAAVDFVTREAFWNVYAPGCDEHLIVHDLHGSKDSIEELTYVAECEGRIVGQIQYTHSRVFDGKDDLLTKTFEMLDGQMINLLHGAMAIMRDESLDMETRCYRIFSQLWRFCLAGQNECMCYIRYYYSPYFTKYSSEQHKKMFESVTERFGRVFKQGTDIWHMLVYVLDIIFSSVIRVFRGDLPNTPETEKNVFELLYHSIQPYLSWERL